MGLERPGQCPFQNRPGVEDPRYGRLPGTVESRAGVRGIGCVGARRTCDGRPRAPGVGGGPKLPGETDFQAPRSALDLDGGDVRRALLGGGP